MTDSSARNYEVESDREVEFTLERQRAYNPRNVRWTVFERLLVILGSVIAIAMMTFLVSSSITATSAQQELSSIQQSITKNENTVTGLRQDIGELTSTTRLNKIARKKGLTLIEKNIRTIH
ncbi:hypothetical protein FC52_GL000396 [Lactobacillus pasteurii DSM 23907 = CRBIP 24.76]|uniref:Cell division protein FtsL n=1 Tax=Lactobacillus pasteurii DSM 23907 = CRBIP 24.76 TaxID=1423790 RepID=I7KLK4_9LACO|nr:cell division protein FtsL [Lactobacillus pasteurii]KRK08697.1 hypothetical protein FC52_GL000396 [Lactobacillus pasteurii DSM 23907 = CRBIP 24.76]TDG76479.1 hypothetical protein C5L33_001238 [Lactobacillus pasteurii]CCI85429.1 Cell division protein FtsL [Lactobacillus pasteurii DSM 23907 = CRBIP 24.76]